jgi:subtilase family serine protease
MLTIPASFTPGPYYVSAVADTGAAVPELDETNNARTTATPVTVTPFLPDLVITTLTAPTGGAIGRPISVSNTVRNDGPAPAGPFQITFYMSASDPTPGAGIPVGSRGVASLAAGTTSAANTIVTIPSTFASAAYYLSAVADSGHALSELSEPNNGMAVSIAVVTSSPSPVASAIAP